MTSVSKDKVKGALRDFVRTDLRWSYLTIAVLIVVGVLVNIIFPNGWMVWPFLFAAGAMGMVHEAADRNGQGIPPLYVYGFIVGALVAWVIAAAVLSVLNPIVLLLGIFALGYQCLKGFLQERERNRIIESRRTAGQCIHCGQEIEGKVVHCPHCGQEPDPSGARLRRVAAIVHTRKNTAATRAALTPAKATAGVAAREQALIARHHTRRR